MIFSYSLFAFYGFIGLGARYELTDRPDPLSTNQRQRIEVVQRNGLRLLKLVNTLLDFSRIEADLIQAIYEPTDLATFTAELASVFRSAIERAGLRLVVDCPPLSELIYVDREMWEKIVLNLLSNAFKFTFTGEITISLGLVGERVELAVQDTGIGIPAAEIPHLFERFYRVKGVQGRTFEGTGIGLSRFAGVGETAWWNDSGQQYGGKRQLFYCINASGIRSSAPRTR